MKLPRHATIYAFFIALLSLFQIALGANLIVLSAIDLVCFSALVPLTSKTFGPNDLLFLSMGLYYGTFSLILKSIVLQPVQLNLQVPYLTSAYLVGGFGMIFLGYLLTERTISRHYIGTTLRTWNVFEKTYADVDFLYRYTPPLALFALTLVLVISIFSNSTLEIVVEKQSVSSLNFLAAYIPLAQLALAMTLSLSFTQKDRMMRTIAIVILAVALVSSLLTNHKTTMFVIGITVPLHLLAYKIRVNVRVILGMLLGIIVTFFYATPIIHIIRTEQIDKSQYITQIVKILNETEFNPFAIQKLQDKLNSTRSLDLASEIDYLAPFDLTTDRFTLLMPIDQIARHDNRAPIGSGTYFRKEIKELLPRAIIGEHDLQNISDEVAWRYSIRENGVIARPALGVLGTGLGIAGPLGLLLFGPLVAMMMFVVNKLVCNGSIWQNPWAVFIASYSFFRGEADFGEPTEILRGFLPMLAIAYFLIFLKRHLK